MRNLNVLVVSGLYGCLYWFKFYCFTFHWLLKYCIKVKLFSDNSGEADEQQQTHAESQTQYSSPATEISHPCVPAPPVQYTSPLLGGGNTMVYI